MDAKHLNKYEKVWTFNNIFNYEVNLKKHMDNKYRGRKKQVHRDNRTQLIGKQFYE